MHYEIWQHRLSMSGVYSCKWSSTNKIIWANINIFALNQLTAEWEQPLTEEIHINVRSIPQYTFSDQMY